MLTHQSNLSPSRTCAGSGSDSGTAACSTSASGAACSGCPVGSLSAVSGRSTSSAVTSDAAEVSAGRPSDSSVAPSPPQAAASNTAARIVVTGTRRVGMVAPPGLAFGVVCRTTSRTGPKGASARPRPTHGRFVNGVSANPGCRAAKAMYQPGVTCGVGGSLPSAPDPFVASGPPCDVGGGPLVGVGEAA